jgi:hypothetical protein
MIHYVGAGIVGGLEVLRLVIHHFMSLKSLPNLSLWKIALIPPMMMVKQFRSCLLLILMILFAMNLKFSFSRSFFEGRKKDGSEALTGRHPTSCICGMGNSRCAVEMEHDALGKRLQT